MDNRVRVGRTDFSASGLPSPIFRKVYGMASDRLPYWTFWPSDFLAHVSWWPNDAVGAYIKVLAHAWLDGPMPDHQLNALLAGLPDASASLVRDRLIRVDGKWTHDRVHTDREKAIEQVKMYRECGRKGQEIKRQRSQSDKGQQPSLPDRVATTPPPKGATSPPDRVTTRVLENGGWGVGSSGLGVQGEGVWPPEFKGTPEWFARLHRYAHQAMVTQAGIDGQMRVCARKLDAESMERPLAARLLHSLVQGWAETGQDPWDALQGILDGLDDDGVKDRGALLRSRVSKFLERVK